jgi:putative flippase GtrA
VVFALCWALTSSALGILHVAAPSAPRGAELAVLVVANLAATLLRFVLLRRWVFRQRTSPVSTTHETHATTDAPAAPALTITEGDLR